MSSWHEVLSPEKAKPYFVELMAKVDKARQEKTVYPPEQDVFNAFAMTPLDEVKVVILGQDPYHGAGQAHGLSFSVQDGVKIPPVQIGFVLTCALCCDFPFSFSGKSVFCS